jgi:hypothetical protein
MRKILGVVGFIGHGKGTVGDFLVSEYKFTACSFAHTLKTAVSAIFHWPRELLEGSTLESRAWREQPDKWWSAKLGRTVTPRWVLQHFGTNVLRQYFHTDIWLLSLEKTIADIPGNVVVTDVRFPNEIQVLQSWQGDVWWVKRDTLPLWFKYSENKDYMQRNFPEVHESEYAWLDYKNEFSVLNNTGDLQNLYLQIRQQLSTNQ